MARTQTTGGKGKGKQWKPAPTDQEKPFAEIDLGASKDGIQRMGDDLDDDAGDEDLPGTEGDDGSEQPRERRFMDRSKTVSKRLGRMERNFNQRFADQEARFQRTIADLKRENSSLRVSRGVSETDQAAHDSKIAAWQSELETAYEKGDTKKQAELTTKIAQAQGEFESKKRQAMLGQQQQDRGGDDRREAPIGDPDNRGNGPTREARKWMRANDDWWNDPEFEIEKQAAIVIDNQLIDEGSDPNDPEHYEELRERLLDKFPDMESEVVMPGARRGRRAVGRDDDVDDLDGDDDRGDSRDRRDTRTRNGSVRRPPVPSFADRGADRGDQPRRSNGRTVTLSRAQRENMITFGLDPQNDDHVKEYAKSAEETNRAYAREGRH